MLLRHLALLLVPLLPATAEPAASAAPAPLPPALIPDATIEHVFRTAAAKFSAHDRLHADKTAYPDEAKGARWTTVGPANWVAGFYPGSLWFLYEYARDQRWPDAPAWRALAETWTAGMTDQQYNTDTHDTGFMIFDSFGNGYRLTENPAYLPIIHRTAQSLSTRFLPATGTIRSWGKISDIKGFNTIIDNMMNLELLVWSSRHGGTLPSGTPEDLLAIATRHADRAIEVFFRPDASTYHVVHLDPATGAIVRRRTAQGKADESTWSRGQTWAFNGFAYMAEATGRTTYLDAARRAADYYLAHLPADHVPPSDFASELTGLEFKDTSAAGVAACGLLRLARLVPEPADRLRYHQAAERTLAALTAPPYFSDSPEKASLLVYSARNYHPDPAHRLTNTSLIFGDYYLLEALLDYRRATAPASSHPSAAPLPTGPEQRAAAVALVDRIATPVLSAGAARELKKLLPVRPYEKKRAAYTHLEAVGRALAGIAPWLELPPDETPEGLIRARLAADAVRTIASITDPASPDYLNFSRDYQPLVDAAFLAHALLRAPTRLWEPLNPAERTNLVAALQATRTIKPFESNWLLFSATVEATLWRFTGECNREPIAYALERHEAWYVGDGTYGDGAEYRADYYNSFVIQPMMLAVLDACAAKGDPLAENLPRILARARRHASIQERQISPEATFPALGRSITYRTGAFQHLADMALRRQLPDDISAPAVRSALHALSARIFAAPGTFDTEGFLLPGLAGDQPALRENYIATGSLYLCLTGFLHLGLPATDPFWTAPSAPWTQVRLWSGENLPADQAYKGRK